MSFSRKKVEGPSADEHTTSTTRYQTAFRLPAKHRCSTAATFAGVMESRGFPLTQASDGEQVEILAIHGGSKIHRRLSDLGLAPGKRVMVVAGQIGGPILVAVGATRIAVGFGMALKVWVAPVVGETSLNETV